MIKNPIPKNNILKQLWIGTCTISEYKQVTDPITHQTTSSLVAVATDEPCRLSYSTAKVTGVSGIATVEREITLFISPEIEIKPGSHIVVTQHGRTNSYKRASEPAIYTNHQEVLLTLDKEV